MHIGAVYPQIELGGDPEGVDRLGKAVEALGFHHLLMFDHVLGAAHEKRDPPLQGPYTDQDPFHDPFVAFGYLAGVTKRILLMTGVIILPQRQTVLLAKQAADVDLLSRGRLVLGVGIGWNHVEYEALGQDFSTRGARIAEQIPYLRRLWSEPLVSFQGRFDSIDRASILPRPRRNIPILLGGHTSHAYRRAAQLADGFMFGGDELMGGLDEVRGYLLAEGRTEAGFIKHCLMQDTLGGGLDIPRIVESTDRWGAKGGTHVSVCSMRRGLTSIDAHIDYFAEAAHRLGVRSPSSSTGPTTRQ